MEAAEKTTPKKKRDPAATKERILQAGKSEFGAKGFGGARIAVIADKAKCNIRMIYHYYGGKQALYLACLDRVYLKIRAEEQKLNLLELPPIEAMETLVNFTFDHMRRNPDFVRLAGVENTMRGKSVKKLGPVAKAANDLIDAISEILDRGAKSGEFSKGIDPFQLYISILSLSYLHLSNKHTLSVTYGRDLSEAAWLDERREHVRTLILGYLRAISISE